MMQNPPTALRSPKSRSKAMRMGRELALRLLYAMDIGELSAQEAWDLCLDPNLGYEGLPKPPETVSVSLEDEAAAPVPEPSPEIAEGWAAAIEHSEALHTEPPAATHTKKEAAALEATHIAQHWLHHLVERREDIDGAIGRSSKRWKVKRMAAIDRNILRIGVFELLDGRLPPRDVIYDCVDLAKKYGDVPTPRFVNGILDQVCRDHDIKL